LSQVLGATFDGASINRRLVKMHGPKTQLVYKVPNPHATDHRQLYFFSDAPHLIKTTRNCWASKCRQLWASVCIPFAHKYISLPPSFCLCMPLHFQNQGKQISWQHLRDLYTKVHGDTGLTLLPKLKYEHVNLTSFSKMRVDLAAQVNISTLHI